jgi:protocatechuate 3,4-dioxygenase beta subunit
MSTFLLSLLFLLAPPAQQTTTPNPADLCTIQGVVVKAGTGEPLHKATVEALPTGNRIGKDDPQGGSAETDVMGRFEMKGLAPGRYYLSAQHNGFVRQQYGQRTPEDQGAMLTLSSGQKVPGITFQMIPAAVITGHVYDEDGQPVVYAQVLAMRYAYVRGQRQLVGNAAATTNDLGEFRLFGLAPGQYFVQATHQGNRFENTKTQQGYLPIYYPGVSDASRAAPIAVRGGDEFSGVDISLQPVRSHAVKGSVLDTGCGTVARGAMVFLREQNPNQSFGFQNLMRSVNAQGAFEFSNVTPGSYYLYAVLSEDGKQCFGRQSLEVADADIDGVTLTVTPGVEIKGRVHVEGQLNSNLASLTVNLSPKIIIVPFGGLTSEPVKPDGSFLLKNATDGDYEINVGNLPENSFVKSARLDGVDVLTSGVTVDMKQAPVSLDIVVSPNGASVDGVISKDQQPFPGAMVALVPDPPHRGEKRLFKSITTDQNGHFVLQGLSPGDYKVFAWEKVEPGAYTSSDFLQPYENLGESVHITEGSRNSVQLDLIPAKDANP